MHTHTIFTASILSFLLLSSSLLRAATPNIIIFLADDFGYGSLNVYGAPEKYVKTPNLNKLAKDGIQFNNAFASGSVCTPTRYTMLTGRYSWRTHLKSRVINNNDPLLISTDTKTVAGYLQDHGYRTAAIGKWHLGYKETRFKDLLGTIAPGPIQLGFDYHFGVPNNLDDLHKIYIENDHIYNLHSDKIEAYGKASYGKPYVGYDAEQRKTDEVMDVTLDKAIEWIAKDPDKPFFLYFGAVGVHNPIVPSKFMEGKSGAGLYGDFIQDVDRVAGRLIDALEKQGIAHNTLIIFTSDNGGDIPKKATTPQAIAIEKGFDYNGIMRGDKHTIYDGGFRVPFIVTWPGKIQKGKQSEALISTADIFATLAQLITGKLPDPNKAAPDSFSFLNVLKNPAEKSTRTSLINRDVGGIHAIRVGKYKYIEGIPVAGTSTAKKGAMEPELYDISKDPSETKNIIKKYPEIAKRAQKLLEDIRENPASRK